MWHNNYYVQHLGPMEEDRDCDISICNIAKTDCDACDRCYRWFHLFCVNLVDVVDHVVCDMC